MSAPVTPLAMILGQQQKTFLNPPDSAFLGGVSPNVVAASPFATDDLRMKIQERFSSNRVMDMGWGEGFLRSTAWSALPELIGMEPNRELDRWRLKNPGSTLLSHLVGAIPAFAFPGPRVAAAAARGFGPLQKAFAVADDLQSAGKIFKAGALRTTAEFSPIFAAQAVGSIFAPQEGTVGRTAQQLAIEIPAFGIFGGLGNVFANRMKGASFPASRRGGKDFEGLEAKLSEATAYPLNQPPQVKYQFVQGLLNDAVKSPESAAKLEPLRGILGNVQKRLEAIIQSEEFRGNPIRRLARGLGLTNRLNALYRTSGGITSRRFVLGDDGFKTLAELEANNIDNFMGVPGWQGIVQGPRLLETTSQKGSARIRQALNEMDWIGDNTWLAEEGAEGAYVVLRRLPGLQMQGTGFFKGLPTFGRDRWILFKTSDPSRFADGAGGLNERLAEIFVRDTYHLRVDPSVPKEATPTLTMSENTEKLVRPVQQALHATPGMIGPDGYVVSKTPFGRMLDNWLPKAMVENRQAAIETSKGIGRTMKGGISPQIHEVSGNPRAVAISAHMQAMFDHTTLRVNEILHGALVQSARVAERGFIRGRILSTKPQREGGLLSAADDLDDVDLVEFTRAWIEAISPDDALAKGFSTKTVDLLRRTDAVDTQLVNEILATRKALGLEDGFLPRKFHYHISRSWTGNFRLPIYDTLGSVKGYGSGHTPQQAIDEAITLIERINATAEKPLLLTYDKVSAAAFKRPAVLREGGRVEKVREVALHDNQVLRTQDEIYVSSSTDPRVRDGWRDMKESDVFQLARDLDPDDAMVRRVMAERTKLFDEDPRRFMERTGKLGFAGSTRAFTRAEIKERLAANVVESQRLVTRQSLESVLKPEMSRLASEDFTAAKRVAARFNAHLGVQGPIARVIDHNMDKLLAPMFGPRAASKAVHQMNQALFFLTLGAGDIGFATLNSLTPLQTVLPEIAYTLSTPPERLAAYYSVALFEAAGRGLRPVSFLDPIRIMRRTLKDIGKNADDVTKAAMERAGLENVITRQGVEAFIGSDIQEIGRFPKLFTGRENFGEWLKALSSAPVAISEEFARAYAFAAGRRMYLDFLAPRGMVGGKLEDAAFEFARRFTLKTNYGYATADRPRILTGTVGTGWGLFRNWTFNYLHNLGSYTSEAFGRGNFMPLAWSLMGTGTVGGVAAMPFYGMADGFARLVGDKSLESQAYEMMGGDPDGALAGDMLMYGPLAALGFTLQSRASVPGTEFLRDMSMMANMLVLDRAKSLGKTLGLVGQNVGMGQNPFNDDRFVRGLMQSFAPRTLQHAWQVWDGNHRSLTTGNVLAADVSRFGGIATMLGFQSTDVRKLFSVSSELYRNRKRQRALIQAHGSMLDQVWDTGDGRDVSAVLARVHADGLMLEPVIRSAQSRMRKRQGDFIDRQGDDYIVTQMRRVRGLGY